MDWLSAEMGAQGDREEMDDDEVLGAHAAALEQLAAQVREAAVGEPGFVERVRAGLGTLVETLAHDPDLARLLFVEARGLDSPRFRPYRRTVERFTALLEAAGEGEVFEPMPPASTARAVASGVIGTISREVDGGRVAGLPRLAPELLFLALVPYVGSEVAAAEMRRRRKG